MSDIATVRDGVLIMGGIERRLDTCFGAPRIAGHRLTTRGLTERFCAGESVRSVADDYGIQEGEVERAIRFELIRLSKRLSLKSQYAKK